MSSTVALLRTDASGVVLINYYRVIRIETLYKIKSQNTVNAIKLRHGRFEIGIIYDFYL